MSLNTVLKLHGKTNFGNQAGKFQLNAKQDKVCNIHFIQYIK